MKVAEILDSPEKWTQRQEFDLLGRVCLFGAMRRAGILSLTLGDAHELACEAIEATTGERPFSVGYWNDHPERTFAEVHAAACEIDRQWMLRGGA